MSTTNIFHLTTVVATLGLVAGCAARTTPVETPASPPGAAAPAAAPAPAAGRTVWDGVYTEAQAMRAWNAYVDQCSVCHSEAMTGGPGAPGVVGPGFMINWDGKTVGELFDYTKAMMPPGLAGSLSDQQYADLVAVILQGNEFPAGAAAELTPDSAALGAIRITSARP